MKTQEKEGMYNVSHYCSVRHKRLSGCLGQVHCVDGPVKNKIDWHCPVPFEHRIFYEFFLIQVLNQVEYTDTDYDKTRAC